MAVASDRLFTPRFLVMCGFSFTVFLSAFQLLPTAPFHIVELGGTKVAAGLFLGCLTYASAVSAPLTGALADRFGRRRMLVGNSLVIAGLTLGYAVAPDVGLLLGLAIAHGIFWSGLLSASSAYTLELIPPHRRAEGVGYWGLSTVLAISVAPTVGLWIYGLGWEAVCGVAVALNLIMAAIAWRLPEPAFAAGEAGRVRIELEWRVLLASGTLFLYTFGYGGITSFVAMYAAASGVAAPGLYFTCFALVIIATRPFVGPFADRVGHRKVLLPSLVLVASGFALLAGGGTIGWLVTSAVVFGLGFGSAYPVFVAHVMRHVDPQRRGAAFGSMLAAFDTGIGSGSIALGWMIQRHGFGAAYALAALVAVLALPYFLMADRRWLDGRPRPSFEAAL